MALAARCHAAHGVPALNNLAALVLAGLGELDPLGYVRRVVADALEVLGYHEQVERVLALALAVGKALYDAGL